MKAGWPKAEAPDAVLQDKNEYLQVGREGEREGKEMGSLASPALFFFFFLKIIKQIFSYFGSL